MDLKSLVVTCMYKLGIHPKIVTPERIIKRLLKTAKQQAQNWGAKYKAEVPNHFIVYINKEDWNRYYCTNSAETAGRIANIVQIKLVEFEYSLCDNCQVDFVLDHGLDAGEFFVEATFSSNKKIEKPTTKQEIDANKKTVVLNNGFPYPSQLRTLQIS